MRYLIKYTKEDKLKFLAHLDLMKTIQRLIRRSEIYVAFSQGYNPHIIMSIAQPLSVGMSSKGEYLDLVLEEEMDEKDLVERLNEVTVGGIKFLNACKVITEKKAPQAMALIDAARYGIKLKCTDSKKAEESLKELMKKESFVTLKKSKKGLKEADIKPLIKDLKFWPMEDSLILNALVNCGSRSNLSANLLGEYISKNIEGVDAEAFVYVERNEMYADKDGTLVELERYFG
ncbi:TIGR03936 family radical SAM-associated protein [Oceanirhabdus seepicola]|uniref:TIGR03936 family radical SAM-associated protein n=1 Tax=Oceanirhabdus seepicola TaxID=2828781 RepID=A0A9J6P3H1_9CLOT|nr:TIGR03936 family radical SAM-associated protein [Oceanirhabdus seepicola]MCM1990726.1 TIGR03936 family radical SAM-associated protein [Oceanirhabdus seepicola]